MEAFAERVLIANSTLNQTTTTTTTTTGAGKHSAVNVQTTPDAQQVQEMPTAANSTPPASQVFDRAEVSRMVEPTHNAPVVPTPDVPDRSPNRRPNEAYRGSGERVENPVSPVDPIPPAQNFSYPKRGHDSIEGVDLAGNPVPSKSGSTLENLKAAAVGIHVSQRS